MDKFPVLSTNRLLLNELETADIPDIAKHAGNKKVAAYTQNLPHPYAEKDAVYWINQASQGFLARTAFIFAIRIQSSGEFAGGIGISIDQRNQRAEIGYWLAEHYWNQGLATEALTATLSFGFHQLGLRKMTASCFKDNTASGRVMEKCGMVKEGVFREHIQKNGAFHDLVIYGLTLSDYDRQNIK